MIETEDRPTLKFGDKVTLRDLYTAVIAHALISAEPLDRSTPEAREDFATECLELSDAILATRSKRKQDFLAQRHQRTAAPSR